MKPTPPADTPELTVSKYFRWKNLPDRLIALILLIPALPIIALLCIAVRLNSRGAAIYKQTRVGRDGKHFTMYKLRSMTVDAESASGPVWTTDKADSRVTRLGKILRATHLDELPQLFNVITGHMALIGPRPERPEFVHVLTKEIENYEDRLKVLPGITGLAQVNLPPDSDLNSVRRKQKLDLKYIETASFLLDVRMMLATALKMLGVRGKGVVRFLGLERDSSLSAAEIAAGGSSPLPTPAGIVKKRRPLSNDVLAMDVADDESGLALSGDSAI